MIRIIYLNRRKKKNKSPRSAGVGGGVKIKNLLKITTCVFLIISSLFTVYVNYGKYKLNIREQAMVEKSEWLNNELELSMRELKRTREEEQQRVTDLEERVAQLEKEE